MTWTNEYVLATLAVVWGIRPYNNISDLIVFFQRIFSDDVLASKTKIGKKSELIIEKKNAIIIFFN